jgi:hypothetical protein
VVGNGGIVTTTIIIIIFKLFTLFSILKHLPYPTQHTPLPPHHHQKKKNLYLFFILEYALYQSCKAFERP